MITLSDEDLKCYEDAVEDGRAHRTGLSPQLADNLIAEIRRLRAALRWIQLETDDANAEQWAYAALKKR